MVVMIRFLPNASPRPAKAPCGGTPQPINKSYDSMSNPKESKRRRFTHSTWRRVCFEGPRLLWSSVPKFSFFVYKLCSGIYLVRKASKIRSSVSSPWFLRRQCVWGFMCRYVGFGLCRSYKLPFSQIVKLGFGVGATVRGYPRAGVDACSSESR
jgi:hypothetical protein